MKTGFAVALAGLLGAGAVVWTGAADETQVQHQSGQNVAPIYEGWEKRPDGGFDMHFGYLNRNYEEHVEIPIGPANAFEPGGADRGQPTHFYPRRQTLSFKVSVPADWGKKELVWTLTSAGRTDKAVGSLLPDWQVSDMVFASMRAAEFKEGNQPPTVALVGPSRVTVRRNQPLKIAAEVRDDGIPGTPSRRLSSVPSPQSQLFVRRPPGAVLGMTWVLYRGAPDAVSFKPERMAVVDGRVETQVTIQKPGVYVLRGYADDGLRTTPVDVTATVTPDGGEGSQ